VLQVFKLHEAYRAVPGAQGDWIAWMSQVHKESALVPAAAWRHGLSGRSLTFLSRR
jgi:hypothetical protein